MGLDHQLQPIDTCHGGAGTMRSTFDRWATAVFSEPHPVVLPDMVPRSLYLHIPFCFHKCHYCDFYSIVDARDRQEAFVDRLIAELQAIAHLAPEPLETIFVGGGTPTLLKVELWKRLIDAIEQHFSRDGQCEWTVECNPETAGCELFETLVAGGVNRLSIGAQSFNPTHLKTLQRWHEPASVHRALTLARRAGIANLSLDLIFGIPDQTLSQWQDDLMRALDLGVDHLSCYCLTYEPNTAMTARLMRGEFVSCDVDLEADMYELTVECCAKAGLKRYEVSNFARPGLTCRHNLAYWHQNSWLAAGPSASGHLLDPAGGSWRWKNTPNLGRYLDLSDYGCPSVMDLETPEPGRLIAETLMTGLRLTTGVDVPACVERARLAPQAHTALLARLEHIATEHARAGLLEMKSDRWTLSAKGMLLADAITRDFLAVVPLT